MAAPEPPVIKDGPVVEVQILSLNDFHGNLEPPAGSSGRVGATNAGGAEYLATHVKTSSKRTQNTIVVSAGDLIGATRSSRQPVPRRANDRGDEPDRPRRHAVGNHEFDEGTTELLRMQNGGCHPVDGCPTAPGSLAPTSSSYRPTW